jgi:putative membrane protein
MVLIPPEDHARISAAVAAGEAASDGEISTMVARQSDDYADWAMLLAAITGFLAPIAIASDTSGFDALLVAISGGWHSGYTPGQIMAVTVILHLLLSVLAWLALRWMPLRLLLTPPGLKRSRVRDAAIKAFRVGIEARTRAATGVLIYLSLAEHRAEILGDAAITAKVGAEEWGEAMAALIAEVTLGRPGSGIVAAVDLIAALLATHFPRSHDDQNEMPDRLIEL